MRSCALCWTVINSNSLRQRAGIYYRTARRAAEGACSVTAYDALSGLKSLEELEARIKAGYGVGFFNAVNVEMARAVKLENPSDYFTDPDTASLMVFTDSLFYRVN